MQSIKDVCTVIDDRTLQWARQIDAPVETIWHSLTDEAELAQWLMPSELDLRVGGKALYNLPDSFGGTISRLEPPHVLEVDQGDGFIRFEAGPDQVAFVDRMLAGEVPPEAVDDVSGYQPGGPGTHWAGVAAGWHGFLDALNAHVSGASLPSMAAHEALVKQYAEWMRQRYT